MTTPNKREARNPCAAPCVFCGYSGEGYWQKFTHARYCPWYEIGGSIVRNSMMRNIIAALTREQRKSGQVLAKALYDPESGRAATVEHFDWPNSGGFVNVLLVRASEQPQQEAPGAVAMWRAMTASGKWMYFDHEPTHMPNYQRLYTTPPAPVDVDVLDPRFEVGFKEGIKFCETHFHNAPVQFTDIAVHCQQAGCQFMTPCGFTATQPLRELANTLRNEAGDCDIGSTRSAYNNAADRIDALLDGQPAGVGRG